MFPFGRQKVPATPDYSVNAFFAALFSGKDDSASNIAENNPEITLDTKIPNGFGTRSFDYSSIFSTIRDCVIHHQMIKTLDVLAARGPIDFETPIQGHITPIRYDLIRGGGLLQALFKHGANPYALEGSKDCYLSSGMLTEKENEFDAKYPDKAPKAKLHALIEALGQHDLALAEKMLKRGADASGKENAYIAPLSAALHARHEHPDPLYRKHFLAADLLFKYSADPNVPAKALPLLSMLNKNDVKAFAYLIDKGASLETLDNDGASVAQRLFESNKVEFLNVLKHRYFDFNKQLPTGETPLLAALRRSQWKMAEDLLTCGADPAAPGANGVTPLEYAKQFSTPETIYALQQACNTKTDVSLLQRVSSLEEEIRNLRKELLDLKSPAGPLKGAMTTPKGLG